MFKKFLQLLKIKKGPRTTILRTEGHHYHLKEVYDRVNQQYFEGKLDLRITWFGPKKSRYQRRVVLGCYHPDKKLIRINRVLDQSDIPDYYISFIVYHEMLHHVAPPVVQMFRRRQIHHPQFKALEKQFKDFARVKEFRKTSRERWFID